jgi:DNA-binding NtrC family response regulator
MGSAAQSHSERVVLVVDDELVACRITARVLVDAGFRVVEVHSAFEALKLLSTLEGRVEVVVSDIAMPGMTGLELAALVAERYPAVPVLLISGQGGPPADYPGAFVPKPFTWDVLVGAVSRLLPGRQDQQQATSSG